MHTPLEFSILVLQDRHVDNGRNRKCSKRLYVLKRGRGKLDRIKMSHGLGFGAHLHSVCFLKDVLASRHVYSSHCSMYLSLMST